MKTKLYIVLITILVIIVLIFIWQNANPVLLKLWFWDVNNIPLSLIIVSSMILGALIYQLIALPILSKKNQDIKMRLEELEILKENVKKLEKDGYKTRKKLMQKEKEMENKNEEEN